MHFTTILWVMLGGAIGSAARYGLAGAIERQLGAAFPWQTLLVNIAGSIAIGLFMGFEVRPAFPVEARQFVVVGLCGGFTTFSTFSMQTLQLLQNGQWPAATGNAILSVLLCVAGAWLGTLAGAALGRP